jgi:hypothetical protein
MVTTPDRGANSILIGLALNDDEYEFVEGWCVTLAEGAPDRWLRGLACLCLGHLARRFGFVGDHAEALERAMAEDSAVVVANGPVLDARDDLDVFLRRS